VTLADAISAIYRQVGAPSWAAANLDGLADVLRDLSWLPPGPVELHPPLVEGPDDERLARVLAAVSAETAGGMRPVRVAGRT
jgi:hypothetical protein